MANLPTDGSTPDASSPAAATPASSRPRRWVRPAIRLAAVLYPLALLVLIAGLHFIGEGWWVTAVALYLPRVVFLWPLPLLLLALALVRAWRPLGFALVTGGPLSLVLMGFVFPWPTRVDRAAPLLRVFSFNVDSCTGGIDGIVRQIEKYSPDIVFLQELGAPTIAEKLAAAVGAKGYPTVRTSSQFLVASRFPVVSGRDPEKLPYEGRPRSPRWVEQVIDTPLGPIAFYNVHPISPREGFIALRGSGLKNELLAGRGFPGDGKELVKNNAGLRARQIEDFARAASEETNPVVIAGDTNSPGLSVVVARNLAQYQDGFANAGWGLGYTFPTGRGPWMRIDRMFASSALRFVGFQVCRTTASDHDCIVADLQRTP